MKRAENIEIENDNKKYKTYAGYCKLAEGYLLRTSELNYGGYDEFYAIDQQEYEHVKGKIEEINSDMICLYDEFPYLPQRLVGAHSKNSYDVNQQLPCEECDPFIYYDGPFLYDDGIFYLHIKWEGIHYAVIPDSEFLCDDNPNRNKEGVEARYIELNGERTFLAYAKIVNESEWI